MADLPRRRALETLAAAGAATFAAACSQGTRKSEARAGALESAAGSTTNFNDQEGASSIEAVTALGPRWETSDPFLFCAHHDDAYPAGDGKYGPAADLGGRRMGSDFGGKDGWNMYHGRRVPGFPRHPHRGFETVTVVRRGLLDHSDSLGARARYGEGDVQWLTAGEGINHAEMFPLLREDQPNPLELFQIWLNLPRQSKMVPPAFSMFWSDTIPKHVVKDAQGRETRLTMVAGAYEDVRPPRPPVDSWASRDEADVAIWAIRLAPGAEFTLPAAKVGTRRSLYFFEGSGLRVGGQEIPDYHRVRLRDEGAVALVGGGVANEVLLLQGRPIGEPIARRGPFVMNTQAEIRQAYADYRATGFGGWPWDGDDPVHGGEAKRFAQFTDGSRDQPA